MLITVSISWNRATIELQLQGNEAGAQPNDHGGKPQAGGGSLASCRLTRPRLTNTIRPPLVHSCTFGHPMVGAVAQLGERSNRTAEVRGSTPLGSTKSTENSEPSLKSPPQTAGGDT